MDPNLLRHIEYFLEPNGQTDDLESQQQRRFNQPAANNSAQNFWDIAGLPSDSGLGSPSSAPGTLNFDAFGQSSNTTNAPNRTQQQRQQSFGQGSRVILPPRAPKPKAGHERKRTKLSTESTPFDNVDYWIQFDNEEGTGDAGGSDLSHQKGKEAQQQRPKIQHAQTEPSSIPTLRTGEQQSRHRQQASLGSGQAGPSNPRRRQLRPEDMFDDSALDYALSEEGDMTTEDFSTMNLADQMSNIDTMPPSEVPPREGLYSTPLSWEKPQPGLRLDSLISTQNPQQLNEDEQRRLIAIAMNTGPVMGGLGSGQFGMGGGNRGYVSGSGLHATLGSGLSLGGMGGLGGLGNGMGSLGFGQITDDAPLLRPETPAVAKPPKQQQFSRETTEKSGGGDEKGKGKEKEFAADPKGKGKAGDRTAHNDIERKYRTNLKDRISELRDAVPALRTIQEGVVDEGDESNGPARPKVSKGTVLTKATEYISYLEKKNRAIMAQHQQLSRRLAAFEQLLSQTARPSFQMPNYSRTLFDPRAFC
ncbi:hypothetical protein J7T55_000131 [Diaporthe amygdali]|uniref:uncharacterized protein n=1 Tax=Phomopsis amygdali TaxID=1214568 RepID=UPI0022FEEEDA|nr:uncharacterized protein J7T55_000131 [Diaporthe amygdali]KAJ0108166.1 hypothetical protein J7T55_000131 [Diaporthe amygdali]